jgi:hypothetical protein
LTSTRSSRPAGPSAHSPLHPQPSSVVRSASRDSSCSVSSGGGWSSSRTVRSPARAPRGTRPSRRRRRPHRSVPGEPPRALRPVTPRYGTRSSPPAARSRASLRVEDSHVEGRQLTLRSRVPIDRRRDRDSVRPVSGEFVRRLRAPRRPVRGVHPPGSVSPPVTVHPSGPNVPTTRR